MYYNLKTIKEFSFWNDLKIMFMTVFAVLGKQYDDKINCKDRELTKKTEVSR